MLGNGIEKVFKLCWAVIKLNIMFISLTLLGGVVLGIGPAFQTVSDLIETYQFDYAKMTWTFAFQRWQSNFKKSNLTFWLFTLFGSVLSYNLYLATQLQGLVWFIISFILMFLCVLVIVLYFYVLLFEASYEISLPNLLKLTFISIFLDFWSFIKVIFGFATIIIITWASKGLILFATFSLFIYWTHIATRKTRESVDGKLASEG